jgi:Protein of unknown function (DUF2795)/Rho termination factor, N-terminal domain
MTMTEMWTFRDETLAAINLDGFKVRARDGAIGKVVRTTAGSTGGYLVVDPGVAMPLGRQLLVPAGLVQAVDVDNEQISVRADREQIKNAPEYDPTRKLDRPSRSAFGDYYGSLTQSQERPGAVAGRAPTSTRGRGDSSATSPTPGPPKAHPSAAAEPTKAELYEQAKKLGIEGRSKMNKGELARAVERQAGRASSASAGKASPFEVQAFLEGVGYPTQKGQLLREAESQGASREVRATLKRLPEQHFESPTEVSEAIGKLD